MINRRRALIGYLTYFFTTRIVGRIVRKKAGDLGPGSSDNGGTGMLNRTKSAPQAMAARTAMLVAAWSHAPGWVVVSLAAAAGGSMPAVGSLVRARWSRLYHG